MNDRKYKQLKVTQVAWRNAVYFVVLGCSLCMMITACQHDPQPTRKAQAIAATITTPPPHEVLFFPSSLRVEDESVNEFVISAMNTCITGEYDAFRLLWSAREEPMQRGEFDKGWKAIEEIRILALEKVRLAPEKRQGSQTPKLVYALYANVKLNADLISAQQKPERVAISMIVQEQGKWRMAQAPKKMRTWLKKIATAKSPSPKQNTKTVNQAKPKSTPIIPPN